MVQYGTGENPATLEERIEIAKRTQAPEKPTRLLLQRWAVRSGLSENSAAASEPVAERVGLLNGRVPLRIFWFFLPRAPGCHPPAADRASWLGDLKPCAWN